MELNKERIGNFIKSIQFDLLPIEGQRGVGEGKDRFVEDWLIIELAKVIYIGKERYMSELIPRRLENNKSFSREKILRIAEEKLALFTKFELLPLYEYLIIYQVGRGLDILLASMLKSWKMIYCCDDDERYGALLSKFFKEPITFQIGPMILCEMKEEALVIRNKELYK